MNKLVKLSKAIRELGFSKLWLYARYQAGLRSGYFRWLTPSRRDLFSGKPALTPYNQFPKVSQTQVDLAAAHADEIRHGQVRLFGADPQMLKLSIGASPLHWSYLEQMPPEGDIKLIWEPARFGWAVTLARAYAFTRDPQYAADFWEKTRHFLNDHPPNLGWQWQSAQEVAFRLMVWVFCDRVFASASGTTLENRMRLWQAVAEHAARIPATLVYARAQNNNHLLAEAAGLYTAGVYLASHPQAEGWRQTGWTWFNRGVQQQITEFGTYVQHSVNYHRLMLQLALFVDHLRRLKGDIEWPEETLERLAASTRWLWALTDPQTGRVPNLGANDGAYLFPLTSQPFGDFRPVVCAAARAFLGQSAYQNTALIEMVDWFNCSAPALGEPNQPQASDMLRVKSGKGRAFLHFTQFIDRPSHADQLHVDLWWHGENVALDPGTYLYNAPALWDNALQSSMVHNTLTVDGLEQMSPAGRFLWLDWAQSEVLAYALGEDGQLATVTAEHDGYRRIGIRHQRKLFAKENGWEITDLILTYTESNAKVCQVRLTWLLPDWAWSFIASNALQVKGPAFKFILNVDGANEFSLVRAGETVYGTISAEPSWGWFSPTYTVKIPALMLIARQMGELPLTLTSSWQFIDESHID